jgi:hypothetical protein
MLDLTKRVDLMALSDTQLADRLERAEMADDNHKKRYGWLYPLYCLSWSPRALVADPNEYWYPSHVRAEIRDIARELERRIALRRQVEI